MRPVKQTIVMRTDLGMRKGKMIAQGAHASVAFLSRVFNDASGVELLWGKVYDYQGIYLTVPQFEWMTGNFTKICLRADSELELLEVHEHARRAGLLSIVITDSGLTEFKGVPTRTCLAIGPHYADEIDAITGNLGLL